MKNPNEVDASSNVSNVIEVQFSPQASRDIPFDISHPASKNYPPDNKAILLVEDFEEIINAHNFRDDYIFHHDKKWNYKAEFSDNLNEIVDKISSQINRIKDDTKRIKFYLDDL